MKSAYASPTIDFVHDIVRLVYGSPQQNHTKIHVHDGGGSAKEQQNGRWHKGSRDEGVATLQKQRFGVGRKGNLQRQADKLAMAKEIGVGTAMKATIFSRKADTYSTRGVWCRGNNIA